MAPATPENGAIVPEAKNGKEKKSKGTGGKKSVKTLQAEEGLERTDNGMKQTSWPDVGMINQKNYYTEYMKRDDQILPLRLQTEASRDKMIRNAKDKDRALARTGATDVPGVVDEEDEFGEEGDGPDSDALDPSKIIVIHPGSQNLRIGMASDALPKTVPMVIAARYESSESEIYGPLPKRQKLTTVPDQQFSDEFSKKYTRMSSDLKIDMRANKRKVLPNSKELVINYNRRTPPEIIPEHNDPVRIDFTDPKSEKYFGGHAAQRIPDESMPRYRLMWPIQHGQMNENTYRSRDGLLADIDWIINRALERELGISASTSLKSYSAVLIIPDLYDKKYVYEMLDLFMKEYQFARVSFIQESLAASFGAGYSSGCIVDIGAQKTSIACVEDGLVMEESRINLKYGGYDVTETFMKMMLFDSFPYADINLQKRHDFLLAEELKIKFCTLNQADISVQLYNFHLRTPNEQTRKFNFKTYDEVILAPMGFCDPAIFDNSDKLKGRHKLFERSYNAYDIDVPDDPISTAQIAILSGIQPSLTQNTIPAYANNGDASTPAKERTQPFNLLSRFDSDTHGTNGTPGPSNHGSPVPEGSSTPAPFVFSANGNNGTNGSPAPNNNFQFAAIGAHADGTPVPAANPFTKSAVDIADERDAILPIAPLDTAIITSIQHAARGDDKKMRDLFGGIMVIGGGSQTPGLGPFLEARLKTRRPDLADKILVGTSPREMDGQVVTWKGASVFGRLTQTNDTWITPVEYERLNNRAIHHKVSWYW